MKLGVLQTLGARIPELLAVLCEGGEARYGTVGNTLIAVNERVLFLGRLCKASKYPPGYAFGALCDVSVLFVPVWSVVRGVAPFMYTMILTAPCCYFVVFSLIAQVSSSSGRNAKDAHR